MFPDGGIARLRAYGQPEPLWNPTIDDARFSLEEGEVDLAALRNGAQAVLCSDMFFGEMSNLIAPGRARVMGEGWETRRSRRVGSDWIVVRLGALGSVSAVILDTNHFKGNYPQSASVYGIHAPDATLTELSDPKLQWTEILEQTTLRAHHEHVYREELGANGPFDHVMLRIYPDGGVSRMRIYGHRLEES
jgi:allantoicase